MVFSTDHNERVDVPVNKIGTQGTQSLDKLTIQINKEDPNVLFHCTKNEVFHYGFPGDLVTFTEEIYNGKLHFLCSVDKYKEKTFKRASYHFPNIPTSGWTGK